MTGTEISAAASGSSTGQSTSFKPQLGPPDAFSFTPDAWPKWKKRFERYRIASGLNKSDESVQVNTFLYVMGDAAEDIFASFSWSSPADARKFDSVLAMFEAHFIPRRNIIHERYMFNRRHQLPGENSDAFITALYTLSEHCEYGHMRDDLIRDHIVLGIRDADLSKKMQMVSDLTLSKAIQMVRTSECVEREGLLQRGEPASEPSLVDKVNRRPRSPPPTHQRRDAKSNNAPPPVECYRCGAEPHPRRICPAAQADCRNCGGVGHYSKMCRSQRRRPSHDRRRSSRDRYSSRSSRFSQSQRSSRHVRAVEEDFSDGDSSAGSFFLGSVQECSSIRQVEAEWIFDATVGGQAWSFEIDSGADDTVAPPSHINRRFLLQKSRKRFTGPDGHPLQVIGMQELPMTYRGVSEVQEIYFIKNQKVPLLGKPAIKAFKLIQRVHNIGEAVLPEDQYADRFRGFGEFPKPYQIVLESDANPFAITVPRKIPLPLLDKTEEALKKEVELGIITKITEPTDWVAPLVVVPKKDGSVRLCVDFSKLNAWVKREHFPMPNVEETLAKLKGGRIFTKLDANSGFHQIRLTEDSKTLTTFLTPFGRFYFNRLPMGITSAPEHFQSQMREILADCKAVVCHMDDILVWGATENEHDENLRAVFKKLHRANVTLNASKCQFRRSSIKFLGHIVSQGQVAADPEKIRAVSLMAPPADKKELQSLLGTLNFLARHLPNRAERLEPLHALLRKDVPFHWGEAQSAAFSYIKQTLSAAPVLAIYDKTRSLIVSCDASSYGLGAVLLQIGDDRIPRPVSYISRTLTKAEQRYAQIEKELLAIAWACDKFDRYLIGLTFQIETDHKPLVPILSTKFLDDLSPRLQRLRMKLLRFRFSVTHTPGKDLVAADLLSRKPVGQPQASDKLSQREVHSSTIRALRLVLASSKLLNRIRDAQRSSHIGQQIYTFIRNGWPTSLPDELAEYSRHQGSLSSFKGLITYCHRIWIPYSLRAEILRRLHSSHMGQSKMYSLTQTSVWWPGLKADLTHISDTCSHCAELRPNRSEPLITSALPSGPWQKVGMDILKWNSKWFLVLADYYSKFIELSQLPKLDTRTVVLCLEGIFARHGVPEILFTDNGTQLVSAEMHEFANEWDFDIVTRSPAYPQANGLAEAAVKIAKRALATASPALALMLHRATPNSSGYSPAQLLMNRQIRTTVPAANLRSQIPAKQIVRSRHEQRRAQMKHQFDRARGATPLPELKPGTEVFVADAGKKGIVLQKRREPRSYDVQLANGTILRRNRKNLRCPKRPSVASSFDPDLFLDSSSPGRPSNPNTPSKIPKPVSPQKYTTRSGRLVKEPLRYQALGPLRDRSKSESEAAMAT